MAAPRVVLVADDEASARELAGRTLTKAGFRVIEARDGEEALELIRLESPALVLLDVQMPGLTGFETVSQMRARGDAMPVLMLTGLDELDRKVEGLSAGADDYVSKNCDPRELLARVEALLRRSPLAKTARRLRFGEFTIDLTAKRADRNGVPLKLTRSEFALLSALAGARGSPVSREKLLEMVWGYTAETKTRTVETHIWRLRKKIGDTDDEPKWILNVAGLGYQLGRETWLLE